MTTIKYKDNITEALARHATESASNGELRECFYYREWEFFNDLTVDELKSLAISIGIMSESEELK